MANVREVPTVDGLRKEIYLDKSELFFIVEGYEKGEPDYAEMCFDDEIEGEYFYERFTNFDDAVEKYLELKEQGWETVRFRIEPKDKEIMKNHGVDVRLHNCKEGSYEYCWIGFYINVEKFCEVYAKKLKEIFKIITENK